MKAFKVTGEFLMGRKMHPFTIEIASKDENAAREYTYSVLGSRHRANRKSIKIENIAEIGKDDVTDLAVKQIVWGKE